MKDGVISIVLPVFNEGHAIGVLAEELEQSLPGPIHFVLVDDGSSDDTFEHCKALALRPGNSRTVIRLSRNFGHAAAVMVGLSAVPQDSPVTLVMDADFQDRPQDAPALLEQLKAGVDCVFAVRTPQARSALVDALTHLFYRSLQHFSSIDIPPYAGNFSAFTSEFRSRLLSFEERDLYFPGIRAYVGGTQRAIAVTRGARRFGSPKVTLGKLVQSGTAALLGFSLAPMHAVFTLGLFLVVASVLFAVLAVIFRVLGFIPPLGFTSLVLLIIGMSGFQVMLTGLVGLYLSRVFLEVKARPRWIVQETVTE